MPDGAIEKISRCRVWLRAVNRQRKLSELTLKTGQACERQIHLVEQDLIRPGRIRSQVWFRGEQRKHRLGGRVELIERLEAEYLLDRTEHVDDRVERAVDMTVLRVRADREANRPVPVDMIDAVL